MTRSEKICDISGMTSMVALSILATMYLCDRLVGPLLLFVLSVKPVAAIECVVAYAGVALVALIAGIVYVCAKIFSKINK